MRARAGDPPPNLSTKGRNQGKELAAPCLIREYAIKTVLPGVYLLPPVETFFHCHQCYFNLYQCYRNTQALVFLVLCKVRSTEGEK
jgi:hypothetical protein